MKSTIKKLTVLLASSYALMACASTPSKEPVKSSNVGPITSQQIVNTSEQQPTSSEQQPSSSEQQPVSSEQKPNSSEQKPSSSKPDQSSNKTSSSKPGSSASTGPKEIKVEDYLVKHEEGANAKYIFEAECTDLRGKKGLGYSGGANASDMAVMADDGTGCVTFLYAKGLSVNFFVACDRDVADAKLSVRVGGEFIHVLLNPETYSFRVDPNIDHDYLQEYDPNDLNSDGSLGNWDEFFLNYYDVTETNGYYIDEWECEEIDVDRSNQSIIGGWDVFDITLALSLKKGINCISMITDNNTFVNAAPHGTMAATAPCVDYIAIETKAQLGAFNVQDNSLGTNACHIDKQD